MVVTIRKPMKKINVTQIMICAKEDLEKNYRRVNFKFKVNDGNQAIISAEFSLGGDRVCFLIEIFGSGEVFLRAIFNEVVINEQSLDLLNTLNENHPFKIRIRVDGYLEASQTVVVYDESGVGKCGSEFLSRLVKILEDGNMKKLLRMKR